MNNVTDAADFFGSADLHGAFGHMHRRPELILITVRVGKIDDGAFVAVGGGPDRVSVRNFVPVEPAQSAVDIVRADVKAAARQILAQSFCRRIDLGLKERADAARSALPP